MLDWEFIAGLGWGCAAGLLFGFVAALILLRWVIGERLGRYDDLVQDLEANYRHLEQAYRAQATGQQAKRENRTSWDT